MPIIKLDDKDYDFDSLTPTAKEQVQSIQFVDIELHRLKAQAAILQTARIAYMNALKEMLTSPKPDVIQGDTFKFS